MKLALFSDVHGHLRIVLHLMRCWQRDREEHLDGALVAGDLGCFPELHRVDNATQKWIERDPEEAGFSQYFVEPHDSVLKMINGMEELGPYSDVNGPILFVAGNHEDYDFLRSRQNHPPAAGAPPNTFPVDCYKKFHCIQDGRATELQGTDSSKLRIAGLWGIENTRENAPYKIDTSSVRDLRHLPDEDWQVFLTHEAPSAVFQNDWGSDLIDRVLRSNTPSFHLFGHVHPRNGQHIFQHPDAGTECILLDDVGFGRNLRGTLSGAMGILEWKGGSAKVEIVDEPWLDDMKHQNWRQIRPGNQ